MEQVKIGERTSSILGAQQQIRVRELESKATNLKRKISSLSTNTQSSSSNDWIQSQIAYQSSKFELFSAVAKGLEESFVDNKTTTEEMKEKAKEISRKRIKAATSMTNLIANEKKWQEKLEAKSISDLKAYSVAIANQFRIGGNEEGEGRDKREQNVWKKKVHKYLNTIRYVGSSRGPVKEKWCAVLKLWNEDPLQRKAAHIIPHFMGYKGVAWQLGDKGDWGLGNAHIWSPKNGLSLATCIEEPFDKGQLVIVPKEVAAIDELQKLRLLVLDSELMNVRVPEVPTRTYSDYHGKELEFKSEGRPALRYLYWHYVTSILRMIQYKPEQRIRDRFPGKKMWPSAGSYFRKSTLKPLAKFVGEIDIEEGDFAEGLFDGTGSAPKVVEDALAAEPAAAIENHSREDYDDEDEESADDEDEGTDDDEEAKHI